MRHINHKGTTLEHIIPQGMKQKEDIKPYLKYGCLRRKWVFPGNNIDMTRRLHTPPYPHFIAYENLVASCDGKLEPKAPKNNHCCCNHHRQNKDIIPIFFLSNASFIVKYEKNGFAFSFFEKYDETINVVNLNHPTLKLMRKAWAKATTLNYSLKDFKLAERDENLRNEIVDDLDMLREYSNLRIKAYWTLFLQYDWFYQYFHERRI
jgi:hypothetical protein